MQVELSDTVAVEVPTYIEACVLLARLERSRPGRIDDLGRAWAVVVELSTRNDDLAILLRDVQRWLESSALGAVRVSLDGREYVLEASDPVAQVVLP
jgi:hypothetical protein